MAAKASTAQHDATLVRSLGLDSWRKLFLAASHSFAAAPSLTHEDIHAALADATGDDLLLDAIDALHLLGTDAGRETLRQSADSLQVDLSDTDEMVAQELAAHVWLEARKKVPYAQLLARARMAARPDNERTYREYVGKASGKVAKVSPQDLQARVLAWCRDNKKHPAVEVIPSNRDGQWRWEIMRGHQKRRTLELKEGRPTILDFTPVESDQVRYEPEQARLGIATRSPRLAKMYREMFGELIANNPAFFSDENICCLDPLQKHGAGLFVDARNHGIATASVVELLWRRGDRDRVLVRGPDCFRILNDLHARLEEGQLVEAKLLFTFIGGGRRGYATLKVPTRIEINAGSHEHAVESFLDAVGIRGAFGETKLARDLWALYPWRHPTADWRAIVGPDFDTLKTSTKVFREVELAEVTSPDHPAARGALELHDSGGIRFGVSVDPAVPMRTLTTSDVAGIELDFSRVAGTIATSLATSGPPREVIPGLWFLGIRMLGAHSVAPFILSRSPSDALASAVRDAQGAAIPVLLVPEGCAYHGDLASTPCAMPRPVYPRLLEDVVHAARLQGHVPAHLWARQDLIVDEDQQRAWLQGVELVEVAPDSRGFKLLLALARAGGSFVPTKELNEVISQGTEAATKQSIAPLRKAIQRTFDAANRGLAPEVVRSRRGAGYELAVTSRVIQTGRVSVV